MLRRFYINTTGCLGITVDCSETIVIIISRKENIAFVKLFKRSFGRDILASFTGFPCQRADTLNYFRA